MKLHLTLLAAALTLSTALSSVACVQCNDIGCGGGFAWTAAPMDGTPLAAGTYVLSIGLDDDVFEITCTIGASYETSDCQAPVHVSGDIDWNLDISLSMAEGGDWDPSAPVVGFYPRASDTTGSDQSGSYTETRGPAEVDIDASFDGAELFGVGYDVEYERDDDYRGDPACGYCDESQERAFVW